MSSSLYNAPFSAKNTITRSGDLLVTAFSKINKNTYDEYNVITALSNSLVQPQTSSIICTGSFGLVSSKLPIGWQLEQITVTGSTPCQTGVYTLNTSSGLLVNTSNTCSYFLSPIPSGSYYGYTGSFDSDASQFLSNAGANNISVSAMLAFNQLVIDLKKNGFWSQSMYAIYPFVAGTPAGDALDLLGNYNLNWYGFLASASAHGNWGIYNNGSTWTNGQGVIQGAYGDSGFTPSNFSPTDISIGVWLGNDYVGSYPMGTYSANHGCLILAIGGYYVNGNMAYTVDNSNYSTVYLTSSYIYDTVNGAGTLIGSRTSSNAQNTLIYNYAPYVITTPASASVGNIYVGSLYDADVGGNGVAVATLCILGCAFIGKGLSLAQMSTMSAIIENYCSFRPSSSFSASYGYGLGMGPGIPITNTSSIQEFILWQSSSCGAVAIGWSPDCAGGGYCIPAGQQLVMCPDGNIYTIPQGTICSFCANHK